MATHRINYLDTHGVGKLMSVIKKGITGTYTIKGRAIFADADFLALTSEKKEAIAIGASSIDTTGIWQYVNAVWTKVTAFDEGYVYDIINDFTTTSDFLEGADHAVKAGINIVAVNTGTKETPVLKWDLFAAGIDLSAYQTKKLVNPLVVFENETPTVYTASADLPTDEEGTIATITDLMIAIIGGTSNEAGDVWRAYVEPDPTDLTHNAITWVKLGNQLTVEDSLTLLSNVAPNTPITDAEIEELWANA